VSERAGDVFERWGLDASRALSEVRVSKDAVLGREHAHEPELHRAVLLLVIEDAISTMPVENASNFSSFDEASAATERDLLRARVQRDRREALAVLQARRLSDVLTRDPVSYHVRAARTLLDVRTGSEFRSALEALRLDPELSEGLVIDVTDADVELCLDVLAGSGPSSWVLTPDPLLGGVYGLAAAGRFDVSLVPACLLTSPSPLVPATYLQHGTEVLPALPGEGSELAEVLARLVSDGWGFVAALEAARAL
jgi:hypothetical protein